MSNSDCQPDITSTLLCFSLWRDLTSEHLPELHPAIHASRGQEPGAWAELHSVDLAVMRVLQDRRPASNWGNRHSQEGGQDRPTLRMLTQTLNTGQKVGFLARSLQRFYCH